MIAGPRIPFGTTAPVPRRIWYVLVAAAWLGTLIGFDTLRVHLQTDPLADVHAYYDAGARLNAGQPLYDQPAGTDDPSFYRYPPLLAILFRPLALLPFETAARIWEAVLIAALVMTVVRMGPRDRWTWVVLGWLAAPIAWSLAVGQAQVAVTFLLAVGAPWAVALAANLKVLPALVAVFWVGRRDWGALGALRAGDGGAGPGVPPPRALPPPSPTCPSPGSTRWATSATSRPTSSRRCSGSRWSPPSRSSRGDGRPGSPAGSWPCRCRSWRARDC